MSESIASTAPPAPFDLSREQTKHILAERREEIMAHHDCALAESMLDIMIAHGVADHAEIDRLEGALSIAHYDTDTAIREAANLRTKLVQRDIEIAELRERLGRTESALGAVRGRLTPEQQLALLVVLACCLGVFIRFGV